jgi:hypothetical protein
LKQSALPDRIFVTGRSDSPADTYKEGSENENEQWNPPLKTNLGDIEDGAKAHAGQS